MLLNLNATLILQYLKTGTQSIYTDTEKQDQQPDNFTFGFLATGNIFPRTRTAELSYSLADCHYIYIYNPEDLCAPLSRFEHGRLKRIWILV